MEPNSDATSGGLRQVDANQQANHTEARNLTTSPGDNSSSTIITHHEAENSQHRKPAPLRNRAHLIDADVRRDSGLAASTASTWRDSVADKKEVGEVPNSAIGVPTILVHDESEGHATVLSQRNEGIAAKPAEATSSQTDGQIFQPLTMAIPTGSLGDLNLQLSGGILGTDGAQDQRQAEPAAAASVQTGRVLSDEELLMSKKVRSKYEYGTEIAEDWDILSEEDTADDGQEPAVPLAGLTMKKIRQAGGSEGVNKSPPSSSQRASRRISMIKREPFESAGGIEDWEEIRGQDVDRYGFIIQRRLQSRASSGNSTAFSEPPRLQRVSTALRLISETPRRKRSIRRAPSAARSSRFALTTNSAQRQFSPRSLGAAHSIHSNHSHGSLQKARNSLRLVADRLPHNAEKRLLADARDMLTLPSGLADIAEQEDAGRLAIEVKRKESKREEKWRRMAIPISETAKGGGMRFDFDTRDSKLVERTWKGIPDSWRATAWHAFLSASANRANSRSDEELIETFYDLQNQCSADDLQIDADVPRTINSHIMFRRRYRGGQRLLFRVLHALSIYFPDIGYVQGMASLAATLLCYYDEEKAFVMMVRLWQLRGLQHLYQAGFGGLMEALDEFEKDWLANGDLAKKLKELDISSTAYGTRWYLTLFNYSIPFQAQLRVWDVFMLLGDVSNSCKPSSAFGSDLDVLHATSAALIDATRDVVLDSDFETAMKVLTSWIPVKDEDLLMKVAKAKWRQRKRRVRS